jgi:hypothetical protein
MLAVELGSKVYHCQLVPGYRLDLVIERAACPHMEKCTSEHNPAAFSVKLATGANKSHGIAKLLARSKQDGWSAIEDVVVHHTHSDDYLSDFRRDLE